MKGGCPWVSLLILQVKSLADLPCWNDRKIIYSQTVNQERNGSVCVIAVTFVMFHRKVCVSIQPYRADVSTKKRFENQ